MATPVGFWYHTRVQFDHTDAQGRVFYAHYFRLLDQARCAYWEALGFSEDDVRQIENDTVIVHVEADYLGRRRFMTSYGFPLPRLDLDAPACIWTTV